MKWQIDKLIDQHYQAVSAIIILLAISLRLYNLGDESLWLDEAVYANNSYTDFNSFLNNTRTNNSSPILLPYLLYLLGDLVREPFTARLLPLIFGVLAIRVVLLFPKLGLSTLVCSMAGFWMALSPIEIRYSQEVREYSLSMLMTCGLLYAYLHARKYRNNTSHWLFAGSLFLTPLSAYGSCFMMLAIVFVYLLQRTLERQLNIQEILWLCVPMLLSLGITYLITAKYQMGVSNVFYLDRYYPPGGFVAGLKWLAPRGGEYISFSSGSKYLAYLSIPVLFAFYVSLFLKRFNKPLETSLFVILLVLVAGSITATFLKMYPFGPIRQQLFASPLVIICIIIATQWLSEQLKLTKSTYCLLSIGILLTFFIPKIPVAYESGQDILLAINKGIPAAEDKDVYVYYNAKPAASFHYPDRHYIYGTGSWERGLTEPKAQVETMVQEITAQMKSCEYYLLFTHILYDEDKEIIDHLKNIYGTVTITEEKFPGANVVKVSRCNQINAQSIMQ